MQKEIDPRMTVNKEKREEDDGWEKRENEKR